MNRVLVVFSDGLLSELDSARGLVSRSAWIRQAVEDKLMKEAVAPLVPDENWDAFSVSQLEKAVEDQRLGKFDIQPPYNSEPILCEMPSYARTETGAGKPAEPKPKARRKKSVKDSPVASGSEDRESGSSFPAPAESPSLFPVRCHCRRGMILAAGPRKGQCTVCGNPKPLKEPT